MAEQDLFTPVNIAHTMGTCLPSLFKVLHDKCIGCAPLVLSSCLLAFLWLLDEEGESALRVIMSVCLYACLCVSLPICPSVCLSACPSICLPLHLSAFCLYPSVCLSVCLSIHPSICLSLHLCMSICLSVCLSVCYQKIRKCSNL